MIENYLHHFRDNIIFQDINDDLLFIVAPEMSLVSLKNGETLIKQDDDADGLFIVISGALQAIQKKENKERVVLGNITPKMVVGEMQVLTGGKRTADIIATEDSLLIKLSKNGFETLVSNAGQIIKRMDEVIRQRLRHGQLAEIIPKLFGPLDDAIIEEIEKDIEWIYLKRGEYLCHQGERGESMFIVINGLLMAEITDQCGRRRVVGEINRGETIGEMTIFNHDIRNASVYAYRNSDVVKISRPVFDSLSKKYPQIFKYLATLLIQRLQKVQSNKSRPERSLTIAVVSINGNVPSREFSLLLKEELMRDGSTLHLHGRHLDSLLSTFPKASEIDEHDPNYIRVSVWLNEQHERYKYIIYECDCTFSSWSKRCLMQTDMVLWIAAANDDPGPGSLEQAFQESGLLQAIHNSKLILIHTDGKRMPFNTTSWLNNRRVSGHFHLRWHNRNDMARLARLISRRSVGLVLGGGGARGFAHIGVIRALEEHGIPIDMIGGTSMGAVISSLYAMGMTYEELMAVNKGTFVKSNPFRDYTIPIVSLIKGKKIENVAISVYQNYQIEDLWLDYYAVSSNITTAQMIVHDRGSLLQAIRATSAIPCINAPIIIEGNLCVDGGVLNNLPCDVMRAKGVKTLIAVDVSQESHLKVDCGQMPSSWDVLWSKILPFKKSIACPTIIDVLMQLTTLSSQHNKEQIMKNVDIYLSPPTSKYRLLDIKKIDEIIELGYVYTKEKISSGHVRI